MKRIFNLVPLAVLFAFSPITLADEPTLDAKSAKDYSSLKVKSAKQTSVTEASANPYIIAVINMSDYTIREMSVDGSGHFNPTPSIGRNCTTTFEDCFQKHSYNEVGVVSCGSVVRLVFKAYKGNTIFTVEYEQFTADCANKGGVVLLENPK